MLPNWIDSPGDEKLAAAITRGPLSDYSPWGRLIASAQATMGYFYDQYLNKASDLYDESTAVPLIAASRVLDSASQPFSGIPREERDDLALSAAVAFGMCGNFLSSRTVIRLFLERVKQTELSPSQSVIIANAAPTFIARMIPIGSSGSSERSYIEGLNAFLYSGTTSDYEKLHELLVKCILGAPSAFERTLLRSSILCLQHVFNLSLARVFRQNIAALPESYLQSLLGQNIRFLQPPQLKAVAFKQVVSKSSNSIVSLHTSTGKTLLGEMCLVAALKNEPGIVCYLAPYVALGRQIANTFREHLPADYRVRSMIGGYEEAEPLDALTGKEVIVATPERFDGLMRTNPKLAESLRCVVVDEAHLVNNDVRGVCLEGIVTRLMLMRKNGHSIRIVLLSAVLSDYENLKRWIEVPDDLVVTDKWKPTARRVAIWRQSGQLTWYVGDDPIRQGNTRNDSVVCSMNLPWPEKSFYPAENIGQSRQQSWKCAKNIAYLCESLFARFGEPILCFCTTKQSTRECAMALGERFSPFESVPAIIQEAIDLIQAHHPFLMPLSGLLRRGVSYHNASLPHEVRRLIEDAARTKHLKAIAATTTLAEGVDLPFRFTVMVDWLTWQAEKQRPIPYTLLKNIAGRCGRAGMLTEGDTIVFDNPLGDPEIIYAFGKDELLKSTILVGNSEPLVSSLSQSTPGSDYEASLRAILSSQFVASIAENPHEENLALEFGKALYWSHQSPNQAKIRSTMREAERSILDNTRRALATAASPLHLTPFGEVAMRSGFSPDSSRRIVDVLSSLPPNLDKVELSHQLLLKLGDLSEQYSKKLRKELVQTRTKSRVKKGDIPFVLGQWISGSRPELIFSNLPSVIKSTITPRIDKWLAGDVGASNWDNEYDSFLEILAAGIVDFLPWLIRGCNSFKTIVGSWTVDFDWAELANYIELGVDSRWAVNAHRAKAPVSRVALSIFGRLWPAESITLNDPLGFMAMRNPAVSEPILSACRDIISENGGKETAVGAELSKLFSWLFENS